MNHPNSPGPAPDSREKVDALVCFAVREEARFFKPPELPVTHSLITGIGVRKASAAIQGYLAKRRPRLVLSCGFAGGLNPAHAIGQVLYNDTHAGPFRDLLPRVGVLPGRFVHADRVVVTAREKQALFEASGADAVEMESSAIECVCRDRDIPVLVLRVISDTAMEDLPLDFNRFTNADGSLQMPRLLLGIAQSPGVVPALVGFQRRLRMAARGLAGALERFLTSADLF